MYISCNNLKKHIKNSDDIDFLNIWNKFTIRTAEVEGVEIKGHNIDGVVVGEILTCDAHPKSKKLHVLTVDVGTEKLQIVCGAPNARSGIKTAVIKVGGHLKDITIAVRPLVGIDSYGMCCSEEELGFADSAEGIMELPNEWVNGTDIKKYLPELEDIIVEIDNKSLTNRPDLWGHYGIAREIAAITNHELLPLDLATIPNNSKDLDIKITNNDLCFRYTGIKLGNITNNQTPYALKIFLYYAGMRSISLLVDLTNYVMLELSQPMHAFDSRKVKNIEIGLAKDKDHFITLDQVDRTLSKDNLMIKNGSEYFAIAGVMGGLDSEILPDTTSIILESASFDATSIRKTATSLGLRTEASARYEKSLDPNLTEIASKRFISLLIKENPSLTYESNLTDVYPRKLEEKTVKLTKSKLKLYMGRELSDKEVKGILESLSFIVKVNKDSYTVIVPTYRATKDITMEADLIEEIARIYGYENFEIKPLKLDLTFKEHENIFTQEYELKKYLSVKYNLSEVHTYLWYKTSFINSLKIAKNNVKLLGKSEDNILRDDITISLLEVAKNNLKTLDKLGIYEIGTEIINNSCHRTLGIVLTANQNNISNIYYEAKSMALNIIKDHKNIDVNFHKDETSSLNIPEYNNNIYISNQKIGELNIINPTISKELAKKTYFVTLKIDFDLYSSLPSDKNEYVSPSKYPSVYLDYTLIVSKEDQYSTIDNILNEYKSSIIQKRELKDIYEDQYEKKITIRYTVGSVEKTLTQEEIQNFQTSFISFIKKNNMGIVE